MLAHGASSITGTQSTLLSSSRSTVYSALQSKHWALRVFTSSGIRRRIGPLHRKQSIWLLTPKVLFQTFELRTRSTTDTTSSQRARTDQVACHLGIGPSSEY